MRKFIRDRLAAHRDIVSHPWLRPLQHWLQRPHLWHLHRRSVAGGVAIGLFCGLIPGPLQIISAMLLAVLFRANLLVAAVTTLYTNPLTIVPLYVLAYEIGVRVSGASDGHPVPALPELHWHGGLAQMWTWLKMLGEPLLIGLPLLAIGLAIVGYVAVRVAWRVYVVLKWRSRHAR